jgi:hypothetical protein
VITNRLAAVRNRATVHSRSVTDSWLGRVLASTILAAVVLALAQHSSLWPLAVLVVMVMELWPLRTVVRGDWAKIWHAQAPQVLMGSAIAMVITTSPRFVTQAVVTVLYVGWRTWWSGESKVKNSKFDLPNLLLVLAVLYEALFLMAAVPAFKMSPWLVLGLVWLTSYAAVEAVLARRGERMARVMAASWALLCAEITWVLLIWLFTYTLTGGYLLVPQPALVLTALAYCFGSIYVSQRAGKLSRGRLTEYLLIGLILIAVVITGTSWKGGTQ